MKGKLTKAMMVAMMLVTVLGLATSVMTVSTTTVSAAVDQWSRMDLPTTQNYQMLPASDIWDLTAAADGTLFALVEDTTTDGNISHRDVADGGAMKWDGLRWAVHPSYSDIAVFKSTDGGYNWALTYHVPATETGAPVAIVPQPGYSDTDSANDTVFLAMGSRWVINRSTNCSCQCLRRTRNRQYLPVRERRRPLHPRHPALPGRYHHHRRWHDNIP